MTTDEAIAKLVDANHILAHERVVDAFGHISMRHPDRPRHFLMSCSRSPELVSAADIMEFDADGEPVDARGRQSYKERDRKSTRLNSSHIQKSRMPSSA